MKRHGGARIGKAVLVSAVTPCLVQTEENPDGVPRPTFDRIIDELRKDRPHFLANFGKTFLGAGMLNFTVTQEIQNWHLMMAMLASPRATLECVRAFSDTDFRHELVEFRVPTLIIHGDNDQTVPFEKSGRRAAELSPAAELKPCPGTPHGLYFTEKDRLNQDLLAFIRS